VRPYFTPDDIEKGARWGAEIAGELEAAAVGIICITRDNLTSPWIMFESGALAKKLDKSRVCPILFGVENADLKGPLAQFQTAPFTRAEIRKLVKTINDQGGEHKIGDQVRESVFDMWWPKLEAEISEILSKSQAAQQAVARPDRELLEEVLELTRHMSKISAEVRRPSFSTGAMVALMSALIETYDAAAAGLGGNTVLEKLQGVVKPARFLIDRSGNTPKLAALAENLQSRDFKMPRREGPDDDEIPF
jgi:hypothetical protein